MGISRKVLVDERSTLKKTFDDLQSKINLIDKESTALKNNLNAVGGAIQQVDKFIKQDDNFDQLIKNGEFKMPADGPAPNTKASKALEIKQKEEAQLLNEGDK